MCGALADAAGPAPTFALAGAAGAAAALIAALRARPLTEPGQPVAAPAAGLNRGEEPSRGRLRSASVDSLPSVDFEELYRATYPRVLAYARSMACARTPTTPWPRRTRSPGAGSATSRAAPSWAG